MSVAGRKKSGNVHRQRRRYNDEPITSFGLILFHKSTSDDILFLLQQRRDTFEYMDFIRGSWRSEGQLVALFTLMSADERRRIRDYTFRELWDDLFVDKSSKLYHDLFPNAKKRYEGVRHLIPNILDTTQTYVDEPPWGFPKGKKNNFREPEIECAMRETEEETRIEQKDIEVIPECTYSEKFQGTNGRIYATHYFLAEVKDKISPDKIPTPNCIRTESISEEAREILWLSYTEGCKYLNPRRQLILLEALRNIQKKSQDQT